MFLVIGYGNSLCGDDGVGPFVVEQLASAEGEKDRDVQFLAVHQLTPELAEPVSRADTVIFVDAACGGAPGTISSYKFMPSAKIPETIIMPGALTHHLDVRLLLSYVHYLYGQRPTTYLYTIAAENLGLGDSFSPAVEQALPSLLGRLKARMTKCMNLALPK